MSIFYRGVAQSQDPRFRHADRAAAAARVWPDFVAAGLRVEPAQVEGVRRWVEERVTRLLGHEDEITANYIICALSAEPSDLPQLWLNMEPLLGAQTAAFFEQLHHFLASLATDAGASALGRLSAERDAEDAARVQAQLDAIGALRALFDEYDPPARPASPDSAGSYGRRPRARRRLSR